MALYPWKMHGGVIFAKVLHNESKVMIGLKHFQWSEKNFPSLISVWPIDSLISALSDWVKSRRRLSSVVKICWKRQKSKKDFCKKARLSWIKDGEGKMSSEKLWRPGKRKGSTSRRSILLCRSDIAELRMVEDRMLEMKEIKNCYWLIDWLEDSAGNHFNLEKKSWLRISP